MALEACASMAVSFVPARNVGPLLPQEKTRVLSRQRFRIRGLSAASEQPDVPPSTHVQENQLPGGGENFGSPKSLLASILSRNDDLKSQLRRYGTAGILSYGVFNTMYYLGTFLFFWFYVAPSPGGLGYAAAAQRFVKLFAMVWAGSQVTKLLRAAAALALAPLVDKCLNWFTSTLHFESREKAFGTLVAGCFALALLVFVVITSLWA
ncbi:uncharacterized protein LOC9650887 isoform X3 [Selaginella moellendorffii]|uniref:uncharacterized protein LOC9650887 isoform X3 n=1 Tax=Selaginella moellendorffii TaxID=88036 RepID=UPI000D1CA55A|nr:uncharacterized protein LOC9650887 isoform X3 [Selaginella moellendorffii]|eukprot:XP_024533129.1 uncharacterized protein LOC9650887 isoform X3 [Selaginella moellendorffii]